MKDNRYVTCIFLGVLAATLVSCQTAQWPDDPINWTCKTSWTWDNKGTPVPCSAEQQVISMEGDLASSKGSVSIGDARWSETAQAAIVERCGEMCATRVSTNSVAENDAARQFEKEQLSGKAFSSIAPNGGTSCFKLTNRTDTQFEFVDNNTKRKTVCTRL